MPLVTAVTVSPARRPGAAEPAPSAGAGPHLRSAGRAGNGPQGPARSALAAGTEDRARLWSPIGWRRSATVSWRSPSRCWCWTSGASAGPRLAREPAGPRVAVVRRLCGQLLCDRDHLGQPPLRAAQPRARRPDGDVRQLAVVDVRGGDRCSVLERHRCRGGTPGDRRLLLRGAHAHRRRSVSGQALARVTDRPRFTTLRAVPAP